MRRRIRTRVEIPDFTKRRDEIGHLSGALRDMTDALYNRIEAIESFAADVAHELKNPLTSLRSAVETLPLRQDRGQPRRGCSPSSSTTCKRLDRLISDISDASRLDAELQRQDMAPVDLRRLLTTLATVANETRRGNDVAVKLRFEGAPRRQLLGAGPRLAARSGDLQPDRQRAARSRAPGGTVRVTCRRADATKSRSSVDDDGPGIRAGRARAHLRALLHRPPAPGLRTEFRARPVDLQADRRGASRAHLGREPRRPPVNARGRDRRIVAGARFVVRLPAP